MVSGPPEVLSSVDVPVIESDPDPRAVALLILSVPALSVVVPVYVLAPDKVSVLAPDLVKDKIPPVPF